MIPTVFRSVFHFELSYTTRLILLLALFAAIPAFSQTKMYPKTEGVQQPFDWNKLPPWISLDMELRSRTEDQTALGYVNGKDRLYELTRVYGGVNLHPTSWFTLYAQFHDLHALGLPLRDVASNMRDSFDLRQGYVNFHYKSKLEFIAGRQELKFGDERVIGISDWTQTSRTWDGFNLRLNSGKAKLDLFSTSVVQIHPTSLDTHGAGLTFHGAVGSVTVAPKTTIEPFVLLRRYPHVLSQQNRYGSETEATFGSEWDAKLPFRFDTSGLGDLQRGSYSNDSIHAGAAIARVGYTLKGAWQPHIIGEYDYSTGNPHRNPLRIGTYDQQYPSNHNAFGLVDLFGFQNIKQDRVDFSLAPRKNWFILLQAESLHLASTHDALYSGSAATVVTPPAGGFLHDGIGTGFDASTKLISRKSFVTNIGVGHFFPGYVMTSRAHGTPLTLVYLQFTYRFRVDHKAKDAVGSAGDTPNTP